MKPPQIIAMACLLAIPSTSMGQSPSQMPSREELFKALERTAGRPVEPLTDHLIPWGDYNLAGWRAMNSGRFVTAEHEFAGAIKALKRVPDGDQRLMAKNYVDYAWAIQKQGRNAEAEPLVKWALMAREALLEPGSPAIFQTQNQLSTLYFETGRFAEAETLLKRAIAAQEKLPKPSVREQSRSLTLLGLLLVSQRRYAESEPHFLKAIQVREKGLGRNHAETGDALNNLAWAYHEQGKDDEAKPFFERALAIFDRSNGSTGASLAHVLNGLAQIQATKGEYDEAESKFRRAIEIWDVIEPGGNASLLDVLKHYRDLLAKTGQSPDLPKVEARIGLLKARIIPIEGRAGPWYHFPDPSPPIDPSMPPMMQFLIPPTQG